MPSSGNGKTGTLREKFARNQAKRDQAMARLEGLEWEEDSSVNIDVQPGATLIVDQSGKHRAVQVEDDDITPTDPQRREKPSEPPQSETPKAARGVVAVLKAVNNPYALGALALLVVALFVYLRFGK